MTRLSINDERNMVYLTDPNLTINRNLIIDYYSVHNEIKSINDKRFADTNCGGIVDY